MEICYSTEDLAGYLEANVKADQEHPLLLDRFLENAIEVDVDALADGERLHVAGIMQHVEEAGVHSGDSACVIPPMSLGEEMLDEIRETTAQIALELGVIGLINIQYAVAGGELYVIEANPRASRTVPFVSKAIGAAAGQDRLPADAGRAPRRPGAARRARPSTSASRRRCCPSPASPAPTRCSARR